MTEAFEQHIARAVAESSEELALLRRKAAALDKLERLTLRCPTVQFVASKHNPECVLISCGDRAAWSLSVSVLEGIEKYPEEA